MTENHVERGFLRLGPSVSIGIEPAGSTCSGGGDGCTAQLAGEPAEGDGVSISPQPAMRRAEIGTRSNPLLRIAGLIAAAAVGFALVGAITLGFAFATLYGLR